MSEIIIGWPQGITISFWALSWAIAAVYNGEPKGENHNFALTFVCTIFNFGLLYWGGFFS